jgi:thioredoxin 1
MAQHITSETYKELLQSGKPLVIDFWATWCGPCKRVAPIIEELATEYADRVNIGKCDVEEDEDLAMEFRVSSIPTIVFINAKGEVVNRIVGAQSKAVLQQNIEALL